MDARKKNYVKNVNITLFGLIYNYEQNNIIITILLIWKIFGKFNKKICAKFNIIIFYLIF